MNDTTHASSFPFGLENSCDDLISYVQEQLVVLAPASALECHDHTLPGRPYHQPRAAYYWSIMTLRTTVHSPLNVMMWCSGLHSFSYTYT
jgi:hypothetical protein